MAMNEKAGWGAISKSLRRASAAVVPVLLGRGGRMRELAPRARRDAHYPSHARLAGPIRLWPKKDGVMERILPRPIPASTALR